MKKVFVLTLTLLLLFSTGCTKPEESAKPDADNSGIFAPAVTQPQYDEDTVLFANQDRADIDDDGVTIYGYNYKGELLSSEDAGHIGFYAENGLAPAKDPVTDLYGFVDKSGAFVIEPQWDGAFAFSSHGLALVFHKEEAQDADSGLETFGIYGPKKCGFVNSKGEMVVPCIYDAATSFYPSGLAVVVTAGKCGVIDTKGNMIIEPTLLGVDSITGDYILCYGASTASANKPTALLVYDLSGNLLCSHKVDFFNSSVDITPVSSYTGIKICTWTDGWLKPPCVEVFDGTKFVEQSTITGVKIESRRVATRPSGYGYGVVRGEEVVIPFEYDNILQDGDFYVAIKYNDEKGNSQTLDIYNKDFEKTASGLSYIYASIKRISYVGRYASLPSGYFEVATYDKNTKKTLFGVIDYTGKIIVPVVFDEQVRLHTYEGIGGNFDFLIFS